MRLILGRELINVARNPLGTAPNAPLASAPGKEYHPPILGMLGDRGFQVNRDIHRHIIINYT